MHKRILIKRAKKAEVDGVERTISGFEKHYISPDNDYSTRNCTLKKADLKKKSGSVLSVNGHEFVIFDAGFIDDYKHMKRLAQIITLKDIGAIITNTGITRDSRILDSGAGSGAVSCYLGMIAKEVVAYDVDERSLEVSRENVKSLGLKNVTIKEGDIYNDKKISEKDIDVFILDVPEPWKALGTAKKVLNVGGFLAVYLPNIMQMQEFVKALGEEFLLERTIEVIEREWVIDARRTRPATKDHSHTGFITFVRRIR